MATITVTNLYDNVPGSLRQAIANANSGDTITFAPNLAGGTLTLTSGELDITKNLTIEGDVNGNGAPGITIDAGGASRVFNVDAGATHISATLDGLVITGGNSGSAGPADYGGGIAVGQSDALTLKNSKVSNNRGETGGGIYGAQGSTVTLTNTSVFSNLSDQLGGGIGVGMNAVLTLTNATISGNSSHSAGGGIDLGGGTNATLTNATIVGNSSGGGGGGIEGDASNRITLYNSTLTGNYAIGQGGGIDNLGSTLTLANSIVAGNAASLAGNDVNLGGSPLVLEGNNILGSTPENAGPIDRPTGGTYTQIDGASQAALATVFARVGYNPHTGVLSGVLADNGGPVRTVAITPGGIAYNAGSNAALPPDTFDLNNNSNTGEPLPVDARGFARVSGGTVDIGAFEQQPGNVFVVTTLADETYDGGTLAQETADGSGLSLREALGLANQDPTSADTIVFDPSLIGGSTHGVNDGVLLLTNGALTINGNVTIEGDLHGDGSADITIDGQGASQDFVITGGRATLDGLTITGGYGYADGGGVSLGSGSYAPADVVISHSIITNNQAAYGGGISLDSRDSLLLTNSTISGNSALYVGGGIAGKGAVELRDTTVSGNSAGYFGGGIANRGALLVINSTLSNNQITHGGLRYYSGGAGLYNDGFAALANTTIAGNQGGYAGGGIYNSGELTLTNVTIANNSAYNGGGFYNAACGCGVAAIYDSTFTGNYANRFGGGIFNANGTVVLTNALVAGNRAGYQGSDVATGLGATLYYGVNLFSQAGVGRLGTDITQADLAQIFADLTTIDPDGVPNSGDEFQAGTLANNGGAVQTVAITIGGSAQNTGSTADLPPDNFDLNNNFDTSEPLPVDARGASRVSGSAVDIGAVEAQPTLAFVPTNVGYTEQAPPVELSPAFGNPGALTVTEDGASPTQSVIAAAMVTVATGAFAGDMLAADTTGTAITASYNAATETLTLTGSDTLADYSQVLDSVTFSSPSDNPDDFGSSPTRIVTWSVTDISGATSAPATTTVSITAVNDPPTLSNVATFVPVVFHGQTVAVSPSASVSDPDSLTLAHATVKITGGTFVGDGDVLAASTTGTGITASYNAATETLTLSGADTLADYQSVLDSVTFDSTSSNPTNSGSNPTRTVTWTLDDGSGSNNLSTAATTTISFQHAVPYDFDANGFSDVLFQNDAFNGGSNTLTPKIWLWNGTAITTMATLQTPTAGWLVVGSGDFNGDGHADILWQNTDGAPAIWEMNGSTIIGAAILQKPTPGWHILATGDFNGDGHTDILWQNVDGSAAIWEMNGTTIIGSAILQKPTGGWNIVAAGDFNGDGNADILWQNADGTPAIWEMNGTTIIGSAILQKPTAGWNAVATGDVNGDGHADILWQNNDGTVAIWEMNGTNIIGAAVLPNPGSAWKLIGSGNFAANGLSDLLFQNADGTPMIWEMNGTSVVAQLTLTNPGLGWQLDPTDPLPTGATAHSK